MVYNNILCQLNHEIVSNLGLSQDSSTNVLHTALEVEEVIETSIEVEDDNIPVIDESKPGDTCLKQTFITFIKL